mgnify:CR=1 FL=1
MLNSWLDLCIKTAKMPCDINPGARKILANVHHTFTKVENDLTLQDCGFTKTKMTLLLKWYYHEESLRIASGLWDRRRAQKKYGSVGWTTYNHLVKGDIKGRSKRASVMGPCIQAGTLTWVDKKHYTVDLFYRTTEVFKKFPADLVMIRDHMLTQFDLSNMTLHSMNFHFANVTVHPMYFVTTIPHFGMEVFDILEEIKSADRYFHDCAVKATARYVCEEFARGIAKHMQSQRVKKDVLERIPANLLAPLQEYCRQNHPGYKNKYRNIGGAKKFFKDGIAPDDVSKLPKSR